MNADKTPDSVRRIEDLVQRVELFPDSESRETALELMGAILEMHGTGLERMLEIIFDSGESGEAVIRRFAADGLISSLLVLHDLHPDDIETRVRRALGKIHGSTELLGVFEGAVRVRVTGAGMRDAVESAIRDAAPDATEIVIEESGHVNGFVPLTAIGTA
jgi:hypothetical protein